MDTKNGLNRHTKFALMAALAAGFVSFVMIITFIDMLTLLFIPSVMIMVFLSARSAFRRQMKGHGTLTGKKIFPIAMEVGTLSHFYTFALYFPLNYFFEGFHELSLEIIGTYILLILVIGGISLLMFVWIAVPMYIGVGHLLKSMENGEYEDDKILNESILDDGLLRSDLEPIK